MAEVGNLRRARKAKSRHEREAVADANRTKHGIAKHARDLAKAREEKAERDADQHRLNNDDQK